MVKLRRKNLQVLKMRIMFVLKSGMTNVILNLKPQTTQK